MHAPTILVPKEQNLLCMVPSSRCDWTRVRQEGCDWTRVRQEECYWWKLAALETPAVKFWATNGLKQQV